jgi:hypothetical protein
MPKKSTSPRTPPKQIRRKGSFVRRVDSSEESPSPHGSIFEAYYQSATNSDESGHPDTWPTKVLPVLSQPAPSPQARENNENAKKRPASTNTLDAQEGPFLYGRGTVLETITERNSLGSIRILARAKSVDELHSVPLLGHQDSFILAKSPRRKRSLSLDDLDLVKDPYHQVVASIERTTQKPLAIHEIYAQPKAPIQEPPPRPETPPGMPSWTEHQLRASQRRPVRRTPARLRQFFGIRASRAEQPRQATVPTGNRSVSAPAGRVPRIARFRPPKSVYGRIDQHPFNRAPTAVVDPFPHLSILPRPTGKRKSVRFTPSATARDSEIISSPARNELAGSSPITQIEAISPTRSQSSQPNTPEKQKQCPHRKGERIGFKRLKHSNSTITGIDYQSILSHPLTRAESMASLPHLLPPSPTHPTSSTSSRHGDTNWDARTVDTELISSAFSNSSTTHLMTGALIAPSPSPTPEPQRSSHPDNSAPLPPLTKNARCWKCKLAVMGEKLDRMRRRSASCLWFVCCGFEADEDERAPRNARTELGRHGAGSPEVSSPGRARGRWRRAESPLGPARRVSFDDIQPRVV